MIVIPNLNFSAVFTPPGLAKLGQIIIGDLTMAGDKVVIMGSLASGLPEQQRRRVLMLGVGMALGFLIIFAVLATQLLKITGLVFAGGLLLLWVAYNLFREMHPAKVEPPCDDPDTVEIEGPPQSKTFLRAAVQIAIADLSMSLDNVLLVASIARDNPALLFIGLSEAVHVMGLAANEVAKKIQRYPWIYYIGLAVILYVAVKMIVEGWVGGDHVLGLRNVLGLG